MSSHAPPQEGAAPPADEVPYPRHWEADVVLRDGVPMHVRPIRPQDAEALQQMHLRQSERSQYFRFFGPMARLSETDLYRFTHVDHDERVALVLTSGEEVLAVGRYDRLGQQEAEVAFYVADSQHGRGLGSVLLEHLAAAARERGVARFIAEVLPGNAQMVNVLSHAGYEVSRVFDDGVIRVELDVAQTGRTWRVMAEREQFAESLSMRALLGADSLLIAGLGGPQRRLADQLAQVVASSDFTGDCHLVGIEQVHSDGATTTSTSLEELADGAVSDIDLAVLAGEPDRVVAAVEPLQRMGVAGVVVLSGGFAEADESGVERQQELLGRLRAAGMRLLGPSSYGLLAGGEHGRLAATLREGLAVDRLGLFCQSQAAGSMLTELLQCRGLGLSSFVSAGNRADVSGNDTMQAWYDDDDVAVAALNLESIGNPRKFSRIARRLTATRPVVVLVSGRTGQLVPPGHPVRRSDVPYRVLDEMLEQTGVVAASGPQHFADLLQFFLSQPLPRGERLAVLTNSTALHTLVTGTASGAGLTVLAEPGPLPPMAGDHDYDTALARLRERSDVDAVLVAHAPPLEQPDSDLPTILARHAAHDTRPLVCHLPHLRGLTEELQEPHSGTRVPAFGDVGAALRALADARDFARRGLAEPGSIVEPDDLAPSTARELLAPHVQRLAPGQRAVLDEETTIRLLECYGLTVLASTLVSSAAEAEAAAKQLGWPVALKTRDEALRHRADLGGVQLGLQGPQELRQAMTRMRHDLAGRGEAGYEVQVMAEPGVACVLRGVEDELYGPVLSFGLGGDAVELLDDVAYRIPPLTDVDVHAMVRAVNASPRLFGHRGLPALDVAALEDVVSRVAVLTDDLPEVREIEFNPILVGQQGAPVLAAHIEVARPARWDTGRRALPAGDVEGVKMEECRTET